MHTCLENTHIKTNIHTQRQILIHTFDHKLTLDLANLQELRHNELKRVKDLEAEVAQMRYLFAS